MSISGGPTITSGDLALYLDAGNKQSYPTTGTTWFDISSKQKNASLLNGATFNTSNNGCIEFDGANDYFSGSFVCSKEAYSVEFWLYPTSLTNYNQGFSFNGPDWGGFLMHTTSNGEIYIGSNVNSRMTPWRSNVLVANTWQYLVWTFTNLTGNFYKNGSLEHTAVVASSALSGFTDYQSASSSGLQGRLAMLRVYNNKVLTLSEVKQNYNVMRGRFGL